MPRYYIDKDLRGNKVYLAPMEKTAEYREFVPFIIEVSPAYKAHGLLTKLNAGLIKDPVNDPGLWLKIEALAGPLGTVRVFKLKL